jgi:hypothetical protein
MAQADELVQRLLSNATKLRWSAFINTMITNPEHQEQLAAPLRETRLLE